MTKPERRTPLLAGLASIVLLGPLIAARAEQEPVPAPRPVVHEHTPVELDGAPIVARVEMPIERPRRLALDASGRLYVVDSAAGRLLRQGPFGPTVAPKGPDGTLVTLADDLDEPAGLALDAEGRVYVASHAGGQPRRGSVVRISPDGRREVFASRLTGPGALAFDEDGTLYVALFHANEIVALDREGRMTSFVRNIDTPAGLAFDAEGRLLAVSSSRGTLSRITRDGEVTVLARDLAFPTDVAVDSRGVAIVANYAGHELVEVDAAGEVAPFASVPPGTIGLALDVDDNLYLANWDFRFVMRMTLHLSVPCPHCDRKIPVRIRPRHDPRPPL